MLAHQPGYAGPAMGPSGKNRSGPAVMSMLMRNLDDRTFDDLVSEGITLLPTLAPEWTNHNPSDPGITLIELLAYFTEILVYRLGRVTPASKLQFLKLLGGANWEGLSRDSKLEFLRLLTGSGWEDRKTGTEHPADLEREIDCAVATARPDQLERAVHHVIQDLMHNECAVTTADFERIAYRAARDRLGPKASVRTLCVPSANLENAQSRSAMPADPGHVSIVLVPRLAASDDVTDDITGSLYERIKDELSTRCLLTTRVHVVAPIYLHLAIGLKLAPKPGQSLAQLSSTLRLALEQRFGPESGQGPLGEGWPFGRALRISELIEAVDETPGVDYVDYVTILQISTQEENLALPESALGLQIGIRSTVGVDTLLGGQRALGPERLLRNDAGRLVSIILKPWELLRVNVAEENITSINAETIEATDE